jgi:PAS domain S-box-containing protein
MKRDPRVQHRLRAPIHLPSLVHYALALALVGGALLGRWLLEEWLGPRAPTDAIVLALFGVALAAIWFAGKYARGASAPESDLGPDDPRKELRLLTDASSTLIAFVDARLRYQFSNHSYEAWLGRRSDELKGAHVREILGDQAFERVRPHIEVALSGKHVEFEMEVPFREGGTRFVRTHYIPQAGKSGAIVGFYALITDITERKRLEDTARRRSELFEALLDTAPIGIYVVDADFQIQQVNPVAAPVFGQIPGGVVGRDFEEVIRRLWPPASADELVRIFRHTLESGESFFAPERSEVRADRGVTEYYEWRIDRIMLPDKRPGVVCYFRDVSQQVSTRLSIARSEARYHTLFNSIGDGFCTLQLMFDEHDHPLDFRYLEVNPAFVKHTGLEDAVGKTLRELVPGAESSWIETYGRVALTGEPARFVSHSSAMNRWFDVDASRIGPPEERQVAVRFTDITAGKSAEQAVAQELRDHKRLQELSCRLIPADDVEALYRDLLDAAIELMHADRGTMQLVDEDTGKLRLLETRGIPPETLESGDHLDPIGTVAAKAGERVIVDYLADEHLSGTALGRAHIALGIRVAQCTPLVTRAGRLVGIIATYWNEPREIGDRSLYLLDILARQAADLIERAQAEEALRSADQRKDEFIATLAHELRNPLAAIRTASSVLGSTSNTPPHVDEMTAVIDRQSSQLVRLIDDLLDISRISRGVMALKRKDIDIGGIVRQTVADARAACEGKGVKLTAAISPVPLLVNVDRVRIAQVVSNLLHNAFQFTPAGGEIRVSVERVDHHAVLRVKDTGVGIPKRQLGQVFDMFAQGDHPPVHRAAGLGIGLSLVKSIVGLHGGAVEVASEGPGLGSEFKVTLPALEGSAQPGDITGMHLALPEPVRHAHRILVADDNRDALEAVALMLSMKGHVVTAAANGLEALEKMSADIPEVALLDIGMPVMDGYELARHVRREAWGKDVLLIALTGWGQERDRQKAYEAGFDVHLTKPVDIDIIERLILSRGAEARDYADLPE